MARMVFRGSVAAKGHFFRVIVTYFRFMTLKWRDYSVTNIQGRLAPVDR